MSQTRAKSEFSQISFNEQMNYITNYLLNGAYPWPAMCANGKCSFRHTAGTYHYDHSKEWFQQGRHQMKCNRG